MPWSPRPPRLDASVHFAGGGHRPPRPLGGRHRKHRLGGHSRRSPRHDDGVGRAACSFATLRGPFVDPLARAVLPCAGGRHHKRIRLPSSRPCRNVRSSALSFRLSLLLLLSAGPGATHRYPRLRQQPHVLHLAPRLRPADRRLRPRQQRADHRRTHHRQPGRTAEGPIAAGHFVA